MQRQMLKKLGVFSRILSIHFESLVSDIPAGDGNVANIFYDASFKKTLSSKVRFWALVWPGPSWRGAEWCRPGCTTRWRTWSEEWTGERTAGIAGPDKKNFLKLLKIVLQRQLLGIGLWSFSHIYFDDWWSSFHDHKHFHKHYTGSEVFLEAR